MDKDGYTRKTLRFYGGTLSLAVLDSSPKVKAF